MLGIVAFIVLCFAFVFACMAAWRYDPPTKPSFGWLAITLVIAWMIVTNFPK